MEHGERAAGRQASGPALVERAGEGGDAYCEAWNFGPAGPGRTVEELVTKVIAAWGNGSWTAAKAEHPHEARSLHLSIEKAISRLQWKPRWDFDTAVARTIEWYKIAAEGADATTLRELTLCQIQQHAGGVDDAAR